MKKIIINENQRGLLFRDGKFAKLLEPGKHIFFNNVETEIFDITDSKSEIHPNKCPIETLINDSECAKYLTVADVKDQQIGFHFVNGKFAAILNNGVHAFWSIIDKHEFQYVDTSTPEIPDDIPRYILNKIPVLYCKKVEVEQHQKGILYFDQKLQKILEPGVYYYWRTSANIDVKYADMRLTKMDITGQEILTQDKVSLRINLVCSYKITDCIKIFTEIDDYAEQIHTAAQLALRDYVGQYKLDEILSKKEEMSEYILGCLKKKEGEFFVSIIEAGVKDIILPGEIREIMNTVLIAEKRAQASVITRREEVASTRSLLNTAKLMDENKTLYKLKELEYIERICEHVGNINLSNGGDILTQLTDVLSKK